MSSDPFDPDSDIHEQVRLCTCQLRDLVTAAAVYQAMLLSTLGELLNQDDRVDFEVKNASTHHVLSIMSEFTQMVEQGIDVLQEVGYQSVLKPETQRLVSGLLLNAKQELEKYHLAGGGNFVPAVDPDYFDEPAENPFGGATGGLA